MRISDWSSDVCSSDLGTCGGRIGACRDDDGIGARRARREQFLKIGRADVMADIAAKADVGDRLKGSADFPGLDRTGRSEEHTSELQSLMRISYAVFCLKTKKSNMPSTAHITNMSHI